MRERVAEERKLCNTATSKKKAECSLWGVKLKTIHRSSVLYMNCFFFFKTHLPLLHGFLVLGDATFNRFVSSFAWWDVFGTGLGMRSNSALGSVRVGVTEIGVNRMFELLFSMHPFQRKTIFFRRRHFRITFIAA